MGQYHKVVNLDKRQVLNPHKFTDGIKLLEFGSGGLTMTGLAVLLACSNGRGGGDLHSDNPIVGLWAGDRIAIVGDYAEPEDFQGLTKAQINGISNAGYDEDSEEPSEKFTDISMDVLKALCDDRWIREELLRSVARYDFGQDFSQIFTADEIAEAKKNKDGTSGDSPMRPDFVVQM